MKAWQVVRDWSIEGMELADLPEPAPGPGQVAVQMKAAPLAPRWSLKAEYLYLNLGRQLSLSIPGTSLPASDIELHTFRIGLNRQFAP